MITYLILNEINLNGKLDVISLNKLYSYQIYSETSQLPDEWDYLASANIFLSKAYLEVLETSAPKNMFCHYIGLFKNKELVGVAITAIKVQHDCPVRMKLPSGTQPFIQEV